MQPFSQTQANNGHDDHLWFVCTNCPKTFQNHRILKNHKRTIHGILGQESNSMFVFSQEELDPGLSILRLMQPIDISVNIQPNVTKNEGGVVQIKRSPPESEQGPSRTKRRPIIEVLVISTNRENGSEQNTFKYGKSLIQADQLSVGIPQLQLVENNPSQSLEIETDPIDLIGEERSMNGDINNIMEIDDVDDIKIEYEDPISYRREQTPMIDAEIQNTLRDQCPEERSVEIKESQDFLEPSHPGSLEYLDESHVCTDSNEFDTNACPEVQSGLRTLNGSLNDKRENGFEDFTCQVHPQPFFAECNFCKNVAFNNKFDFAVHALLTHSWPLSLSANVLTTAQHQKYNCSVCPEKGCMNQERLAVHLLETGHVKAKFQSDGNWKFVGLDYIIGTKQTVTVKPTPANKSKGMTTSASNSNSKSKSFAKSNRKSNQKTNLLPVSRIKISTRIQSEKPSASSSIKTDNVQVSPDEKEQAIPVSVSVNPLACTKCDRSFRRKDYRLTHESQVHGIIHDKENKRNDRIKSCNTSNQESDIDFDVAEEIDPLLEPDHSIGEIDNEEIIGYEDFSSVSSNQITPGEFLDKCSLCEEIFIDKFSFALHDLQMHFPQNSQNNYEQIAGGNKNDNSKPNIDNFLKISPTEEPGAQVECNTCIDQAFENRELFVSHLLRAGHIKAKLGNDGLWKFINSNAESQYTAMTKIIPKTSTVPKKKKKKKSKPNSVHALTCTSTTCIENSVLLKSMEDLSDHIRKVHQENEFISRCAICQELLPSQIVLGRHFRKEHSNSSEVHYPGGSEALIKEGKTPIPRPRSKSERSLAYKRRFQCDVEDCKRYFSGKSYFEDHKNIHLGLKPYKCSYCHKTFSSNHTLGIHERLHKNVDKFECETCGKKSNSKMTHDKHILSHMAQKEFKCEDCGKFFKNYVNLRTHRYIHKPEKRKKCELCGKVLGSASNLKIHLLTHRAPKSFKCDHDQCDKKYSHKVSLSKHKHKVHSGFFKIHICSICGKTFKNDWALDAHEKKHANDLPFECEKCHRRYAIPKYLSDHMYNAHGEREFICEICGVGFKSAAHLRQHESVHTGVPSRYARKPKPKPTGESSKSKPNSQRKKRKRKEEEDALSAPTPAERANETEPHVQNMEKEMTEQEFVGNVDKPKSLLTYVSQ